MNGYTNGDHLPPASTHAAQLVRDHATITKPSHTDRSDSTFGQLLQEILNNNTKPEKDPEVNYRLVQVVTEAGLDILSKDDPFANWDTLIPQGLDSIAVIRSTIVRQPELLFIGPAEGSDTRQVPHLLLWLLPKLFAVISQKRSGPLHTPIAELLAAFVFSLSRSLDWWEHGALVQRLYRDCVDELTNALFSTPPISLRTINVVLPPARSIASLRNVQDLDGTALPLGNQHHIIDGARGLSVACTLLNAVEKNLGRPTSSLSLSHAGSTLKTWLCGNVHCYLLGLIMNENSTAIESGLLVDCTETLLLILRSICLPSEILQRSGTGDKSGIFDLYEVISTYLSIWPSTLTHSSLQGTVAFIIDALTASLKGERFDSIGNEALLPALLDFAVDHKRFTSSIAALQKAIAVALKYAGVEEAQLALLQTTDGVDVEMSEVAAPVSPPRRLMDATAHQSALATAIDPTEDILHALCFLLVRRQGTDLAGLGEIAG